MTISFSFLVKVRKLRPSDKKKKWPESAIECAYLHRRTLRRGHIITGGSAAWVPAIHRHPCFRQERKGGGVLRAPPVETSGASGAEKWAEQASPVGGDRCRYFFAHSEKSWGTAVERGVCHWGRGCLPWVLSRSVVRDVCRAVDVCFMAQQAFVKASAFTKERKARSFISCSFFLYIWKMICFFH